MAYDPNKHKPNTDNQELKLGILVAVIFVILLGLAGHSDYEFHTKDLQYNHTDIY